MLDILIVLVYYNRPRTVKNALRSINEQTQDNWHLAFIDDGSTVPGKPIVEEILKDKLDKITFYRCDDTVEQKNTQGGSRHPEFMNRAILECPGEIVVICCDDDALMPNYCAELSDFYENHPIVSHSYCHFLPFNPSVEKMGLHLRDGRTHHYNFTHTLSPYSTVDSSQVSFRRQLFLDGLRYPSPATSCLDAALFAQITPLYGLCPFNGILGQYKGWYGDQLGFRGDTYNPKDECIE